MSLWGKPQGARLDPADANVAKARFCGTILPDGTVIDRDCGTPTRCCQPLAAPGPHCQRAANYPDHACQTTQCQNGTCVATPIADGSASGQCSHCCQGVCCQPPAELSGVLTREVAAAEGIFGGFSAVYDVLKALEDAGRIRRGYFVGGVGATQFALPAALDLLRSLKEPPEDPEVAVLAATDPANPYGTILKWPASAPDDGEGGRGPTRTVGSLVVLVNGALAAYISRGARQLLVFLPEDEPARSMTARALAAKLASLARDDEFRVALLIGEINGVPSSEHPLAPYLVDAGFSPSAMGFQMRRHA